MRRSLLVISFLHFIHFSFSQKQLQEVIPASPNVAALGKYGEVPVDLHTGVPNIKVPLTSIVGKDISVDIELSYHAGGVKVEEISSWVGLGWTLFAGGAITRQVRGLPDEGVGGFFWNTTLNSDAESFTSDQIQFALNGMADFEPDIFYFNFCGQSGKFFYDQESETFVTVDRSRLKIKYLEGAVWKVVSGDGTTYYFSDDEMNSSVGGCPTPVNTQFVPTGWFLNKIVNANRTDSIVFEYELYSYSFESINVHDRIVVAEPIPGCESMEFEPNIQMCFRQNQIYTRRLTSIRGRSGSIVFEIDDSERADLPGDYALKTINCYNWRNDLLVSYRFAHTYFGPSGSTLSDRLRLRLDTITRRAGEDEEMYRRFEYSSASPPSRLSNAQDYWGYYNGANSNISLIPPTLVLTGNGPLMIDGANRYASTSEAYSQAGMLESIIYPTGGRTLFEYENHRVNTQFAVPASYRAAHLDRSDGEGTVFTETFEINSPPSFANGFNPQGGSFVNITTSDIYCDYGQDSGMASEGCAVITLTGPTGFHITNDLVNRYLPNGQYTITADFSSNNVPGSWEDFYVGVSWKEIDQEKSKNAPAGGLRIKKISDLDPVTNSWIEKTFKYNLEHDTLTSSAVFDSLPKFARPVWFRRTTPCGVPNCTATSWCRTLKISAFSSYPAIGSERRISYSFVTVLEGPGGKNGKSTFKFINDKNQVNYIFPYTPAMDFDWRRGKLLEQKDYIYRETGYTEVRTIRHHYKERSHKSKTGVRIVPAILGDEFIILNGDETAYQLGMYMLKEYPVRHDYFIYSDTIITIEFDQNLPSVRSERKESFVVDPFHLQTVASSSWTSNGGQIVNYYRYADSYDSNTEPISTLRQKNMIGTLIEQSTWSKSSLSDSTLISATVVQYDVENEKIFQKGVFNLASDKEYVSSRDALGHLFVPNGYEREIEFIKYDPLGNFTEAIGRNGILTSVFWGDNGLHPISIAEGAASDQVFYTSFEDQSGNYLDAARTGRKSFTGSFTVNIPSPGTYHLSYFRKTPTTPWELVESTIAGSTVIGGGNYIIDELRLIPISARIKTFTYDPGVGLTSQTDANNISTFFEYYPFGRLKVVRDNNYNIIRSHQYHFSK